MIYDHILVCNQFFRIEYPMLVVLLEMNGACTDVFEASKDRILKADGQATMGVANCSGPGGNRTHDQLGVSEVS